MKVKAILTTLLTTLLLLTFRGEVSAQHSVMLTQSQIAEDNHIFIEALKKVHPGLDIYLSQSQVDSLFKAVNLLEEPILLKEYYLKLLEAVASISDGHTDIDEGPLFRNLHPYSKHLLPFEFKIIEKKVYVSKDYTFDKRIPAFAEVVSINALKADQLLAYLYKITPSDGNREDFKERYNEILLNQSIPKIFGLSHEYEVVFRTLEDSTLTRTVKGTSREFIDSHKKDKKPLALKVSKEGNYAILTLNTFQYRLMMKEGIDFHKSIKGFFKSIKKDKIENIIIDLRENYGGDNILAIALYSYLKTGRFKAMAPSLTKLVDTISVSRYSNFPARNYPFLSTHEVSVLNNGYYSLSNGIDSKDYFDSDYIFKGSDAKPEYIAKNKFQGKIYCLISGLTFSAGANFAALLKRDKEVTFIGQETGGANGYYCGGGFFKITLPNSKFMLQIPYMKRCVYGATNKKLGTIPNFFINRTPEDISQNKDIELMKAIEMIQKQ